MGQKTESILHQPIQIGAWQLPNWIILQLWHVGRISDPSYLDGKSPLAPSAVKPAGHVSLIRPMKEFRILC